MFSICFVYAQTDITNKYKIVNKISLDGNDKWDYLFSDDAAGRLYVSHGSQVHVIDQSSGKIIGKIAGLNGVHGIAIDPELKKGFISTRNDNSVTAFDTQTLEVIKKMTVSGCNPDAILYDSFSKKVFTGNGLSNNMSVIDPKTFEQTAVINLPGNPEFIVSDEKGHIYVNIESASSIAMIDVTTNKVEKIFPLAPGTEPTGLALDNDTHRLFSACANEMMIVLDAISGKVITSLPIGLGVDGAAFDPELKSAYSSNGDGTMAVIKENQKGTYSVVENVKTPKGSRTITINKMTHHIYLPSASFETAVAGQKPKLKPDSFQIVEVAP